MQATGKLAAALLLVLLLAACSSLEAGVQGALGGVEPDATQSPSAKGQAARAATPELAVPAEAVRQEGELAIRAAGFAPGETVILAVEGADGQAREISRVTADANGQVAEQRLTLPEWLTSGAHRTTGRGEQSGRLAESSLLVRAKNHWVQVDSYAHRPAEKLGFVAGGFVPGEQVRVYLGAGATAPTALVETDRAGNTAWSELVVPMLPAGEQPLRLVGSEGEVRQTITIQPFQPSMELSPWSGPPGSKVELNARGFAPGETVRISLDGENAPALTLQADQWGNFWGAGPLTVAQDRKGEAVSIVAAGEQSGIQAVARFAVQAVKPWGELSTYAGYPGNSVLFSGGGFAAGERVTVHVGDRGSPAIAVGTTNEHGRFWGAGPAVVPVDATRDVAFVFVGEQSGGEAIATFKVLSLSLPERPG